MTAGKKKTPREGLRRAREACGLSQAKLAEKIGVGRAKTIARWESGETVPYAFQRPRLADELGITPEELEALLAKSEEEAPRLQGHEQEPHRPRMAPSQPSPYFTGRAGLLAELRSAFLAEKSGTRKQALIGQPGIGKTQVALAYAARYGEEYRAILWATADTRNALISDFMRMASTLRLPEKDDPDKQRVIDGVKEWLNANAGWLLVVDNVDDPNLLHDILPQEPRGHILLTARDPEVGTRTTTIAVEKLGQEDGATLLLRRAKRVLEQGLLSEAAEHEREKALEVSERMDGHPLALDQGGAYIAEARCTVAEYLEFYVKRRKKLLDDRGRNNFGHPDSLAATILLSFDKVEQQSPVAADVLRMCAFLRPDDVPEELFTVGAAADEGLEPRYGPVAANAFLLAEAMRELVKYSFVQRRTDAETGLKTVSVHRLVQAVLKDQMDGETQFYWSDRAVWVMARTLSRLGPGARSQYQRYIAHALACIELIERWEIFREDTIYLMVLAGNYLRTSGLYAQAMPLCQRACDLAQRILGPEHDIAIMSHNCAAQVYENLGDYKQAESTYLKAVALCARKSHPATLVSASVFYNLAYFYKSQARYAEAGPLAEQAHSIQETVSGPEAEDVAGSLALLAEIDCAQKKFGQAEALLERASAISGRAHENNPLANAPVLNSWMLFYYSQRRYEEAQPLCQPVLEAVEKEYGPKHREVARICTNAAEIYRHLGDFSKAEQHCQRAMEILEENFGPDPLQAIPTLCTLAVTYQSQGKYSAAESYFKRAQAITAKALGSNHPDMASVLSGYVLLLREMERFDEADALYRRVLHIQRLWPSP